MMLRRLASLLLFVLVLAAPALAVEPDEMLSNPALEARARTISAELRCLVCQNQSIDDSNAPLARDLRLLVRDRLKQGDDEEAVLDFIVARYGQFVLLKPRFESETLLLWLATPAILILTLLAIIVTYRRRSADGDATAKPLSAAEQEALSKALDER